MNKTFKQKVVIITGGSTGIGKACAIKLAKQGAKISIASRNGENLEKVAQECRSYGTKAIAIPTDVSDKDSCKQLIEKTVKEFQQIDMLINNAGYTMWAKFENIHDFDPFEKLIKVKLNGSIYCTYYALPYLKLTKGRIVAVSSLTGKVSVPTRSYYSASNHAIAGFFNSIRTELACYGISVSVVYPGFVATKIRERALGHDGKSIGKSHISEKNIVSTEVCADIIINAALERQREVLLTFKDKLATWLNMFVPQLVDIISKKKLNYNNLD